MSKHMYSLTNPQKSIWQTGEFYKGTSIENISGRATILEKVDFKNFSKAINLFIKKNDSFRLKFTLEKDGVKQYVEDYEEFSFEKIHVFSEKDVKKIEDELSNYVFDVLNSYLFKFVLYEFEDGHGGFVIVMHHLISDAWTSGLVISDIIDYYDALKNNEELSDEKTPSYIEYINSEKEYEQSEKYNKDKEFWNNLFDTIPEVATIPSSNSTSTSCSAKRKQFIINKNLMDLIHEFCKTHKVSEFNFFMGVLSIYLGRVSNLEEFVIGTPILNRSNFKEKHTSGMFISVVPFKVSLEDLTFVDFISKISKDFFNIFRHQKYSYQTLLEDLRKKHGNDVPNLYNVMFSYQNMRSNKQTARTNYDSKWLFCNNISDDLEIHMYDINDTGNIIMAYDFKSDKYKIEDIYSIHERVLNIINQVLENNGINLKDIEIVTPDEKKKLLYDFNNTKMDYPKDKTITQLFEEQVLKTPDNIAVVFGDKSLTYKELNERANSLAHYLLSVGITKGDVVPILLDRSIELIVSMLSVIKIGAIYLPLSTEFPPERLNYIFKDSNSKYIITSIKNNLLIPKNLNAINIDTFKYRAYSTKNTNVSIDPKDVLYIIYTSGSTGNPKGVKVLHQNLNNFINSFNNLFENISNSEKVLASTNICFDVSIFEFYISLLNGCQLYLYSENIITDIFKYCDFIIKNKITLLYIPPNILEEVYTILKKENYKLLNKLLLGVEPIKSDVIKKYYTLNPNIKIINAYGPTETTICATALKLDETSLNNYNVIPIGKPLHNLSLYVLDKHMRICPISVPGELYICGDNVSNGYLNNQVLTNKSFVNITYANTIAYKTGDIVKWDNNGIISFIGRNDSQIKIHGHRIELGEINSALKMIRIVKNSITIVKNVNNAPSICSYVILDDINYDIAKIKNHLRKTLPYYMVPTYITQISEIPLTPNGKIDTKKLPDIEIRVNQEYAAPSTSLEIQLSNIIFNVFNVNCQDVNMDFFDIGLDSLSAIRLCAELHSSFNLKISSQEIFEHPTIKTLASFIESVANYDTNNAIINAEKKDFYPTSSAQKRTYFASIVAGEDSVLYNICGGLILDSIPDIKKLENAFNTLIKRQSSLRTYFEIENNNLVQKIENNIDFKLNINSNLISENNLKNCFKEFIKPFDLTKAPLFRVNLQYLQNKKAILMVDMHHIISDGTSLSVFLNELCKIYNNEELPEIKMEYKDYAVWENNKIKNNEFKEAEKYWVNQFKDDIPVLDMPTNYPRPALQSFDGKKVYSFINEETTKKINELANVLKVTPYMLLLSVYYVLLYKYTSQEDIVVGSPVVNRTNSEFYNVIGMFVNSMPMKASINPNENFVDFVKSIKDLCLENYKYQDFPFDELVNQLNIQRDTSRNPLFDTMFIYQNNGYEKASFNGINADYYIPDSEISKFDLSLEIVPENNMLNLSFEYATSLFNNDFICNLSNHYINIINKILENNEIKISEINILSTVEQNKILYEFNDTKMDYPKDKTIVQLFEEQVEKTPDNVAASFEKEHLNFKELNEKANSLAYYLRENSKIARNDIVGIMCDRSLEMIVSIVAVLKAGGAYLLLDNTLPFDRIEYMLNNCKAKVLLIDKPSNISFKNKIVISDIEDNHVENLETTNNPEDLFAVIYTSGSTGKPKGVSLKHIGMVNLVFSFSKILDLSNTKNHLGFSSVSFDMFAVELFSSILLGRTLFLLNDEELKNPIQISNCIIENKIEFLITTPTKIELLLSNEQTAQCLKTLKGFQLGGEVFTSALFEKLLNYTNAKIYNGYGPTEITACCSNKLITSKDDINIGNSNPNTQIYILDKDLNPCPVGVPGELYIAGDGVSNGYINNLEKTNDTFINNKFGSGKMYKTGDLGRFNNKGEIEYIGRNDFQVKVKGLRIELSEIEKQMLNIEYIQNCVVLTDVNKTYLKAFFTASEELNIPNIRKQLLEVLPAYMVPNYIFQIQEIPMTSNGKVDRHKLDEYKCDSLSSIITYVEPENETQKLFCNIWEEILQTKVGIDNDLFELGADSLSAIKFKVEALNHNIDIPYSDIFKYKTIRKLSGIKQKEVETTPIENYDYTKINSILKDNKIRLNYKIENNKNNNILLFGSNGFVGMHIINSFIHNDNGKIYCVMRDKNNKSALERFSQTLEFYFGKDLNEYINSRIIVIKGDISKENFGMSNTIYNEIIGNISTVINAAANVKHYGNFEKFKSINIDSTVNVINFCKKYNKRLLHLSTLSISGNTFLDGETPLKDISKADKVYFAENNLYINQSLDNVYTRSKFEAEKIILDNISLGLNAVILRLGNITSRYSDGKFQINPDENAFTNRLKSVILLGVIPKYLLEQEIEFTPVDLCADAIVKIMQNKCNKISVFHIYNSNHIKIQKILSVINNIGIKVSIVSDKEFTNILNESIKNSESKKALSGIINDLTPDKKLKYSTNIKITSLLSINYLLKCKFKWKKIDKTYIEKYFNYLKNIKFFKEV